MPPDRSLRPHRAPRVALVLLCVFAAAGCGSETSTSVSADGRGTPKGGEAPKSVDTRIDPSTVGAGGSVAIVCTDDKGRVLPVSEVDVLVAGPEGSVLTELLFSPTLAGGYTLACRLPAYGLQDPEPAFLQVEPGRAARVETEIKPQKVRAGEAVQVACAYEDVYGNTIEQPLSYTVDPSEGVEITGSKLTATLVGAYDVACRDESSGLVDTTPARLAVEADVPRVLRVELDPSTIEAGGSSKVSCSLTDRFGNRLPVDTFPMVVEHPSPVQLDGFVLSGIVAGVYRIRCLPQHEPESLFELLPADLSVIPGPPVDILVERVPDKPVYRKNDTVDLQIRVVDAYDNLITDIPLLPLDITPPAGVKVKNNDNLKFVAEGNYTVLIALEGYDKPEDPRETLLFTVDGTGPVVTVEEPPRGLTDDGKPVVNVAGTINDDVAGLQSFAINDFPVKVKSNGSFSLPVPLHHGMNVITIDAVDAGDNLTHGVRAVYWSPTWYPFDKGPEALRVPRGMILHLRKDFIDDGVHDPGDPNDLATILEVMIGTLDLGALMPNPVASAGSYKVYLKNLKIGKPKITLTPLQGAIHLTADLGRLTTNVDIKGKCKILGIDLCPDFSGNITIQKIALVSTVHLKVENELVLSSVGALDVTLTKIDVNINGIFGWLFGWLIDIVVDGLTPTIEQTFESQLRKQIATLVGDMFGQLSIDQQMEIKGLAPGMAPVLLALKTGVQNLDLSPAGMVIEFKGSFSSTKKIDRSPLGSIGRSRCVDPAEPGYTHEIGGKIGVALYDDLLNEALFSIWWAGGLNLTAGPELLGDSEQLKKLGIKDLVITTNFFLPPILNDCDEDGQLRMHVGDIYLVANMKMFNQPVEIGIFAEMTAPVEILLTQGAAGPELGVSVKGVEFLDLEIVSISENFASGKEFIENLLKEKLSEGALDGLMGDAIGGFPLPEIDLSSLSSSFPPGIKISIVPESIERRHGYTVIQGDLK